MARVQYTEETMKNKCLQKYLIYLAILKYTPTPKRNITKLKRDVVEFTRKLRLIEKFSSEEKEIKSYQSWVETFINIQKQLWINQRSQSRTSRGFDE